MGISSEAAVTASEIDELVNSTNRVGVLIDITPEKFACVAMASCPAVLKDNKAGRYVIIGQRRDPDSPGLRGRVGIEEVALEISAELLESALLQLSTQAAHNALQQINVISIEAGQLFLSFLNTLAPAAISPELSAQIQPQTQSAAASSS
jgi:hypothetical protein